MKKTDIEPTSLMDALGVEEQEQGELTKVTVAWDAASKDLRAVEKAFGLVGRKGKLSTNIRKSIVALARGINAGRAEIYVDGKLITAASEESEDAADEPVEDVA